MRNAIRFSPQEIYNAFRRVEEVKKTIHRDSLNRPGVTLRKFQESYPSSVFIAFDGSSPGIFRITTERGLSILVRKEGESTYELRLFGFVEGYKKAVDIQRIVQTSAMQDYEPQFSEVAQHVNETIAKVIKLTGSAYELYDVEGKSKRKQLIERINNYEKNKEA